MKKSLRTKASGSGFRHRSASLNAIQLSQRRLEPEYPLRQQQRPAQGTLPKSANRDYRTWKQWALNQPSGAIDVAGTYQA